VKAHLGDFIPEGRKRFFERDASHFFQALRTHPGVASEKALAFLANLRIADNPRTSLFCGDSGVARCWFGSECVGA